MASQAEDREERRWKIMERGSDRLALISGRIHNLHPPSSSATFHNRANSESYAPMVLSQQEDHPRPPVGTARHIQDFEERKEKPEETGKQDVPEALERRQAIPGPKPSRNPFRFFSSKALNSSIIRSEVTRSLCALTIACAVVLSYVDYPLTGINFISSLSIVALKPLYVLLLTDAAILLTIMCTEASGTAEEGREEKEEGGRRDTSSHAEKLLERGLAAYQTFRGLVTDCSVYVVVVVCGLSFV